MRFPAGFVERLRDAVNVSEIVGRRIPLKRQGHEFAACCPFHKEKTASFTVNDAKGFYHCFGCGAHGDALGFIRQYDGLDFVEAVERLAQEAGIPIPVMTPQAQAEEARRMSHYDALEAAARWFEDELRAVSGMTARQYLRERGLEENTLRHFRLGFAPPERHALYHALREQDLPTDLLVESGLLIRSEQGEIYDRFRGRIMFPIADGKGRVIAFGGRALGEATPKYLNSPETPLFHKGHTLYHLKEARLAARDAGHILVVEGYMDVIALTQAGFAQTVAPLGTALTEHQLAQLWRMTPEIILCLDGDAAGQRAMHRAAELALPRLEPGLSLHVLILPEGEDPDSYVRHHGSEAFRRHAASADSLAEWLWKIALRDGNTLQNPDNMAALESQLMQQAERIGHHTVRRHYRDYFKRRLWQLSAQKNKSGAARTGVSATAEPRGITREPAADYHQRCVLAAVLHWPELLQQAELEERLASLPAGVSPLDKLRQAILEAFAFGSATTQDSLWHELKEKGLGDTVAAVTTAAQVFTRQFVAESLEDERPRHLGEAIRRCLDAWEKTCGMPPQEEAAERLAQDLSEDSWQRFVALKMQ